MLVIDEETEAVPGPTCSGVSVSLGMLTYRRNFKVDGLPFPEE